MEYYNNDYLMHYGVQGMKWGTRRIRGHAGPGRYITRKRQLAGDKRDLKYLEKGGHLSVGLTKKRQAAYDKRDKDRLEKRIAKNEEVLQKRAEKKNAAKATNPNRSREIAIAATASIGTAMAAYGVYRVSKAIKDKSFNHSVSNGMRALEALESRGRFNDGLDDLKDIINRERSSSVASVIKRTIDNNSVNGRVDWANIKKIYM